MTKSKQRMIYWTLAAGWMILIIATLGVVRPICEFLREHLPFGMSITIFLGLLLAVVIIYALRENMRRPINTYLFLTAIIGAYIGMFIYLSIPEERVHLLQYGVLAFLIYRAVAVDLSGFSVYFYTFILASFLGWVDESIQHITPGRFFDWKDVLLNAISAFLALALNQVLAGGYQKK